MAMQHLLVVVLMASVLHVHATSSNLTVDATSATAYDILEQNKFPRGLLPLGVKSYVLHGGVLEVTLPRVCDFFVAVGNDQYKFRYDNSVGGVIKPGSITQAYGVRVFAKTEWLGFGGVERVGDHLTFDLQRNPVSFPISSFTQSPKCN
jgi:hypothetical protein